MFDINTLAPKILFTLSLVLLPHVLWAEAVFPRYGFVTNLNSDTSDLPDFLQLNCELDNSKPQLICLMSHTTFRLNEVGDGQCIIDNFFQTKSGDPFIYDFASGTASRSGVLSAFCDSYIHTESMHFNEFGLPELFEEKWEVIKPFMTGEERVRNRCEVFKNRRWVRNTVLYQSSCNTYVRRH